MAHNPKCYCRWCGGAILWVKTANGRTMPVDYDKQFDLEHVYNPAIGMKTHFASCKKYKKPIKD